MGPPGQEAMGEDRQGLWVGEPEGAGGQAAVGGEGYRGNARVLGGYQGWMQGVRRGSIRASGAGDGRGARGPGIGRGGGGPAPRDCLFLCT